MTQKLDSGEIVTFGQDLREVEKLLAQEATDAPIPEKYLRGGLEKIIKAGDVWLWFDSGRLKKIQFNPPYRFDRPLMPYPEDWKNFPEIGKHKLSGGMSRDEFLSYLEAWEKRAVAFGAIKMECGEDLAPDQYTVGIIRDFADMVSICTGPSRRTRGGGVWCDGWTLFFKDDALDSVSAFRDEFNTVARRKPDNAPE